jgi:hypothetical protein
MVTGAPVSERNLLVVRASAKYVGGAAVGRVGSRKARGRDQHCSPEFVVEFGLHDPISRNEG